MKKYILLSFLIFICFPVLSQEIDILILNKAYEEALTRIDNELENEPTASLYLKKGLIYSNLQDYQSAVTELLNAYKLNPGSVNVLTELAEAYSLLGNNIEATKYFELAYLSEPGNLLLAGKLGKSYISTEMFSEAYDVFSEIYQKDSSNVYWNKQLAYCASSIGKISEAIDLYNLVLEMNPQDLPSSMNLIAIYLNTDQDNEALNIIEKELEYFPFNPELHLRWANILFNQKNFNEAQSHYETYLQQRDSTLLVLKNYGVCLYFNKQEEKALQILMKCLNQALNDPVVLYYVSLCNNKLKQFELAEAYMNTAIEAATPFYLPEMYHHLGQILKMQRKFEESIRAFEESFKLDPENYELLFEIALTYDEYNYNKTFALNFYNLYLTEGGAGVLNSAYAFDRITKIKEDLFFEE